MIPKRLLNARIFSDAARVASQDNATLRAVDKYLIGKAGRGTIPGKAFSGYLKHFMGNAHLIPNTIYGKKGDSAKLITMLGGALGGLTFGGAATRPFYSDLPLLAKKINPHMFSEGVGKTILNTPHEGVVNLIKPGLALTSRPAVEAARFLGGEGSSIANYMASSPLISTFATPALIYGGLKAGSKMLSLAGRRKRLQLLRQGIAPKLYAQQARQIGFK